MSYKAKRVWGICEQQYSIRALCQNTVYKVLFSKTGVIFFIINEGLKKSIWNGTFKKIIIIMYNFVMPFYNLYYSIFPDNYIVTGSDADLVLSTET